MSATWNKPNKKSYLNPYMIGGITGLLTAGIAYGKYSDSDDNSLFSITSQHNALHLINGTLGAQTEERVERERTFIMVKPDGV
jgi:hypothetical protein